MTLELRRPPRDPQPGLRPRRKKRPWRPAPGEEFALRLLPDGTEEAVPLTRELLLNPSFEVKIVQGLPHNKKLSHLYTVLNHFLEARGLTVTSDVGLIWPGERTVSPDGAVVENMPPPAAGQKMHESVPVTGDCRVRTVFEIVSKHKDSRWKDEEKNPPLFARHGVEELVLLYLPQIRRADDVPVRVFTDPAPAGYRRELQPDAQGFFELRSIGVRIGVASTSDGDGEKIVLLDARTGEPLPDIARALQEKQQADEARRRAEEAQSEMAAEIERLRAELQAKS